jgi:hypothetical protein
MTKSIEGVAEATAEKILAEKEEPKAGVEWNRDFLRKWLNGELSDRHAEVHAPLKLKADRRFRKRRVDPQMGATVANHPAREKWLKKRERKMEKLAAKRAALEAKRDHNVEVSEEAVMKKLVSEYVEKP